MIRSFSSIENVGWLRTAACEDGVHFEKYALLYGENGSGKSTISDILRSLSQNEPDIVLGRKTLSLGDPLSQRICIEFDDKTLMFDGQTWQNIEHCPPIRIFDSIFVNDNVYSGDTVSMDHMKRQNRIIIGKSGVQYIRNLNSLYEESKKIIKKKKEIEKDLLLLIKAFSSQEVNFDEFQNLEQDVEIDIKITEKKKQLELSQNTQKFIDAKVPDSIPLPSEVSDFEQPLKTTIEGISDVAVQAVQDHIKSHENKEGDATQELSLEAWLKHGMTFTADITCPFCGQNIVKKDLIEIYNQYFSDGYRSAAEKIESLRKMCEHYKTGGFRKSIESILSSNASIFRTFYETAGIDVPEISAAEEKISALEIAAAEMETVLAKKTERLVGEIDLDVINRALSLWDSARNGISDLNSTITNYNLSVEKFKEALTTTDPKEIQNDLETLMITKARYDTAIVEKINERMEIISCKSEVENRTKDTRDELAKHTSQLISSFGETINEYLDALNANFRIEYRNTNFRGDEPAADYNIVINNVKIQPRSTNITLKDPSFANTLSAGDKSVLALSLFLSQCKNDSNLSNTIIVLDDPFTSLDNYRRHVTAARIREICKISKQAIVLSHDKNFLRMLGGKLNVPDDSYFEFRYRELADTKICPLDIEDKMPPRNITERMKIEEFLNGEPHDPSHVRSILRTACESFYRKVLSDLDGIESDTGLGAIVAVLSKSPSSNPYKKFVDTVNDINHYSRTEHHGYDANNPGQDTTPKELQDFCKKTLFVTSDV